MNEPLPKKPEAARAQDLQQSADGNPRGLTHIAGPLSDLVQRHRVEDRLRELEAVSEGRSGRLLFEVELNLDGDE